MSPLDLGLAQLQIAKSLQNLLTKTLLLGQLWLFIYKTDIRLYD